ncbi:TPA: inorganic pyrophosphatase [Haemophilus influenzae]|uniref:major capsid protein n=1 Tax=Haemophilus influenzae TaxID=727 RepID=UPI0005FC4A9D|nr:inorganic pyrophosphatase [Haemophilus influenzae]AKA47106.1 inorganic pyrophosphatase [Haemophilus influenzae 2019]AWP55204.1 inorganic pyrophosphatase [Haemophilus influenzae]KKZ20508.1 inorganic pyrophosphatase [Haemophilus influenzae 2019]KMZ24230.1 inorganic pyrophosphatase [Haemophilus influenzae]KMZ26680.1 inorganic pyrophosphatase [Haemophilus influenzae]
MTAHNLAALRVQDPVLTKLAQGYHNLELIGEVLMPTVEIDKEAGKIPKFGRLAFRLPSTVRNLRGTSNRLDPEDITAIDVALEEHDVEYAIDYREENEAIFSLRQFALNTTQDVIALGREKEVATLALDENKYDSGNKVTLSGTSKITSKQADIFAMFDTGIRAVKRAIGRKPNVCVIAGDVWAALKEHPAVIEKLKYSQVAIVTPEVFGKLIGIDTVKIGEAVYEESNQLKDIWSDAIVLAYVAPRSTERKGTVYEPSYGYTVRRQGGLFVDTYKENGGKLEVIRTTDIHKPHLLGASAGYLIKGCL